MRAAAVLFLAGTAGGVRDLGQGLDSGDGLTQLFEDAEGELPKDEGAWKHSETRKVAYEEIGRCYDPGRDWDVSTAEGEAAWEAPLKSAVQSARGLPEMPHAQALKRPINRYAQKVGPLAQLLPWHRAVGLTSQRRTEAPPGQFMADSHCFLFDYESFREGDPDPHGCGFFRRSFQPLQQLRQCIVKKLEADPAWQAYTATAGRILGALRDHSRVTDNPAVLDEEERTIAQASVDVAFDSIRRADEIVKTVAFKPWEAMTAGEAAKLVEQKISKTVVTTSKTAVLGKETVEAIRKECFLVSGEDAAALPERTVTLKRALPCYELMWDQVEVAGAPEQPMSNAITMWDKSLVEPARVEMDYDTPPVCARAAVALVVEKQKRAPERYSSTSCIAKAPSWKDCMAPKNFNCICFQMCWRRALERVCEVEPGCCWRPGEAEAA